LDIWDACNLEIGFGLQQISVVTWQNS